MRFPRGHIDGIAVREMYEAAAAMMDQRNVKLMVDLTGVDMLNSGAMGMLVTMRKKFLHTGGQLHIAAPDPLVLESLRMMHLDRVLTLFESVSEAMARFKG